MLPASFVVRRKLLVHCNRYKRMSIVFLPKVFIDAYPVKVTPWVSFAFSIRCKSAFNFAKRFCASLSSLLWRAVCKNCSAKRYHSRTKAEKKIMCSPWFSRCWISRFNRPVSFFANACSRARRRSSLFYGWRWVRSHSRFDQCCESQTFFSSRLRCALPTLVWVKVIASRDGYTYAKRPLG